MIRNFLGVDGNLKNRERLEKAAIEITLQCGFRSSLSLKYGEEHDSLDDFLDTDPLRRARLKTPLNTKLISRSFSIFTELSLRGAVVPFAPKDFQGDPDYAAAASQIGLDVGVAVPILADSALVGVVKFSDRIHDAVSVTQENMLMAGYLLYAAMQTTAGETCVTRLTPRERQVMTYLAIGMTSGQIANALNMAERTVNQHAENVATKLRTKNRAHSVAEVIRFGLI